MNETQLNLLARLDAIDLQAAMGRLNLFESYPNYEIYKQHIIDTEDEAAVAALEAENTTFQAEIAAKELQDEADRLSAEQKLADLGLTKEELIQLLKS